MTDVQNDITLGDLVTTVPGSARVLERFGLDYCCGGRRPLGEACEKAGVDAAEVRREIEALDTEPEPDWASMGPRELVDHVERTHHAYLGDELPRLMARADKVAGVHGGRHPELVAVRSIVAELRDDFEPHLAKEERMLFPAIRQLADAGAAQGFPFGSIANPVSMMMREHDQTGEILTRLRAATRDYAVPADGCASYAALYQGLEHVERDTHLHIHKENNLLFPAVVALEGSAAG
jgi:regulator of cell morphogenesis and NO signaling